MKKVLFSIFLMFSVVTCVLAQTKASGKVSDEKGEPMIGVNVILKGTTLGTATDIDGKYSLEIPANETSKTLVFSFLGYEEQEADASQGANITLMQTAVGVNTVVVSASKRQEKLIDAPASITVLSADKIANNNAINAVDNLTKVPGVDIMQTGLVSQNITVRGFNNIFSGALMTLVDNRITGLPSLKVNAAQLIQASNTDIEQIEVVRGPGSALYGPNSSDGVLHIITKSPLDMPERFNTTISMMGGARAKSSGETSSFGQRMFWNPEIRHSGKITDNVGYKISGNYFRGKDWIYYDPAEPTIGSALIYGSVKDGNLFVPDTNFVEYDAFGNVIDSTLQLATDTFDRDFQIEKFAVDGRMDFRLPHNIEFIVNGGVSRTSNIELTGLGAAQGRKWLYYYSQMRFKWKNLFVQYYLNATNSGETNLIPRPSGSSQPYPVQRLVDKSKMHVIQAQHSFYPWHRLQLIYGVDFLLTRPETDGTIHGRFEDDDNTNQYGGYLQADLGILKNKKLSLVAAARVDYHDRIKEVQFSPRAALVYKPSPRHTLRATYNRAFSSPSSLNLFLDLSNGLIPSGINIRGLGNAQGYDYHYGSNGLAQYHSPYTNTWNDLNDKSNNSLYFDNMTQIIANGLASQTSFSPALVQLLLGALFQGIGSDTGTIMNVNHSAIDYLKVAAGKDSILWNDDGDISNLSKVEGVKSTITQTYELGYKGLISNKLMITADFYYSRIKNYVSPLTMVSPGVIFNQSELFGALQFNPSVDPTTSASGILYDNLQKPSITGGSYDNLLSGLTTSDGTPLLDGVYAPGGANGTVWDDLAYLLAGANQRIPFGSVTPDNELIGSDMILVYQNLGTIDVAGIDLSLNYIAVDNERHNILIGAAGSFVNKDRIPLKGAQYGYVALNAPKFKTSVSFEHNTKKLGIGYGINWRWQDAFVANSAVYSGYVNASNLIDVSLSYRPQFEKTKGIAIVANVNNLLNYRFQRFPGTPEIGRMGSLKLSYTF